MLYLTDLPEDSPTRNTIRYHVKALSSFWGEKSLADVKGSTCRQYILERTNSKLSARTSSSSQDLPHRVVKSSTARQELKTFQAAINHWHRESPLSAVPKVSLPKASNRRERVLERSEVARMLLACRRLSREGHKAAKGAVQYTDYSHVARFILIGLYTGTRHDKIVKLRWAASVSRGHIDLERNVVFRRGGNEVESTKRSPPVGIKGFLALYLRACRKRDNQIGNNAVISVKNRPVTKMRRAWKTVREAAGLGPDVTPHVLRHTCASWLLWGREAKGARPAQKPMTIWEVAGVIGADASTVEKVYGHHRRPE